MVRFCIHELFLARVRMHGQTVLLAWSCLVGAGLVSTIRGPGFVVWSYLLVATTWTGLELVLSILLCCWTDKLASCLSFCSSRESSCFPGPHGLEWEIHVNARISKGVLVAEKRHKHSSPSTHL
jgi:hypothetical protein